MSKRSKSNRFAVLFMVVLGAATGAVGLALYVKMNPASRTLPSKPQEPTAQDQVRPKPAKRQVLIPVAKMEDGRLSFTSQPFEVSLDGDARLEAINEFLRTSKILDSAARATDIKITGEEAKIDFTKALEEGSGSFDEATLIQGLRAVLGQFPEIVRFRLYVEGHEVTELGHFELGDPIDTLPVNRWSDPEGSVEAPPPSMPR